MIVGQSRGQSYRNPFPRPLRRDPGDEKSIFWKRLRNQRRARLIPEGADRRPVCPTIVEWIKTISPNLVWSERFLDEDLDPSLLRVKPPSSANWTASHCHNLSPTLGPVQVVRHN